MRLTTIVAVAALLVGSACSPTESPSTPRSPASSESATASATGRGETTAAVAPRRIDPRRGGLDVAFGEFAITLEAAEIRPGPVTFVLRNGGRLVHGFEMEVSSRESSGHGSGDGFKVEGRPFRPGETIRFPMELSPGVYEVECFVAEHDDMGMRATLVVRAGAPLVRTESAAPGGVEISDFAFSPSAIDTEVGAKVTWTNTDPTEHTVTARDGAFDSGAIDPGGRFTWTFDRAGTFAFLCQIHPTMTGIVRVADTTT